MGEMSNQTIRVLLVDDHRAVRESVASMFAQVPGRIVVGQTSSVAEALELIAAERPDVVLVDLWLRPAPTAGKRSSGAYPVSKERNASSDEADGLQLVREARARGLDCRFVAFTGDASSEMLARFLAVGGNGYVGKTASAAELLRAVEDTVEGRVPILASFVTEPAAEPSGAHSPDDPFSPRELEVLVLVAKGLSSKEAAEHLAISPTTVDTYRRRIAVKLGSRSRAALVRYALAHGLLD
jgi:two-component system response regulator NreC